MYVGDDGFCFLPLGGTTSVSSANDAEVSGRMISSWRFPDFHVVSKVPVVDTEVNPPQQNSRRIRLRAVSTREVTIHLIVPNIHQCLPRESAIDIKKPPSSQRGLSFKTYQPCLGYALNDQFRWIRTLWCEAVSSLEILQCFFHLRFIVVVDHHQWLTLLHLRANLLDF